MVSVPFSGVSGTDFFLFLKIFVFSVVVFLMVL